MANTRSGTPLLPTVLSMLVEEDQAGIPAEPAAEALGPKGQRVPDDDPEDADDRHGGEAVHHRAQDVLGPDEAAVEHRQAGNHQQDQGGGDQHPGRGARVDGRLLRWPAVRPSRRGRARPPGPAPAGAPRPGRWCEPGRVEWQASGSPPLAVARVPGQGTARRHGHGAWMDARVPPGVRPRYGSAPRGAGGTRPATWRRADHDPVRGRPSDQPELRLAAIEERAAGVIEPSVLLEHELDDLTIPLLHGDPGLELDGVGGGRPHRVVALALDGGTWLSHRPMVGPAAWPWRPMGWV